MSELTQRRKDAKTPRPIQATLIFELNRVYSDTKYPGDEALANTKPSEWAEIIHRLRGKSWNLITIEDFDSFGGIIESVQALSPRAVIYFLPGLVKIALTQPEFRHIVVQAILPCLTTPEADGRLSDWQNRILAGLSLKRRIFLISFLEQMRDADTTFCTPIIAAAISSLRAGSVIPYEQKAVKLWINKNSNTHS